MATITWSEARNIYSVRKLLEAEAAEQCAKHRNLSQIKRMRAALKAFGRVIAKNDVGSLLDPTTEFYEAMFEGSGNPVIAEVLRGLNARISVLHAQSMSQRGRPPRSLAEMTAMLRAIEQRDGEAARIASIRHVENAAGAAQQVTSKRPVEADVGWTAC